VETAWRFLPAASRRVEVPLPARRITPQLTRSRQPAFASGGQAPGIRPVRFRWQPHGGAARNHAVRAPPGFPSAFACRHLLLERPVPASPSAFLTVGLPASPPPALPGPDRRNETGFPRSARVRPGRAGCPLYPGDDGVLRDRREVRRSPLPPSHAASPYSPQCASPARTVLLTGHQTRVPRVTLPRPRVRRT
jgi:hypothetical protein